MRLCVAQKSRTFWVFPLVPHFVAFDTMRLHFLPLKQCERIFFAIFSAYYLLVKLYSILNVSAYKSKFFFGTGGSHSTFIVVKYADRQIVTLMQQSKQTVTHRKIQLLINLINEK